MNPFGLDIGSKFIKVVNLEKDKEKFRLVNYGMVLTPQRVLFSEAESDLILLAETIKKLVKDAGIINNEVITALPESKVFTQIIELPLMTESELQEAIKWEAEQYIPQSLNEVRLSWDILYYPGKKNSSEKMRVLLVAAPIRLVDRYVKILSMADLKPVCLETETTAVLRAFTKDIEEGLNIIINLGASATQILAVNKGILFFSRLINTGGEAMVRAIATELNLDTIQAEEYKKAYGLEEKKLEGKIKKVLIPVTSLIVNEIKKGIAFCQEKLSGEKINKIIITGGSAKMPGIIAYLTEELSLEVIFGNPFTNIIIPPKNSQEINESGHLYSCALGLALRNLL